MRGLRQDLSKCKADGLKKKKTIFLAWILLIVQANFFGLNYHLQTCVLCILEILFLDVVNLSMATLDNALSMVCVLQTMDFMFCLKQNRRGEELLVLKGMKSMTKISLSLLYRMLGYPKTATYALILWNGIRTV